VSPTMPDTPCPDDVLNGTYDRGYDDGKTEALAHLDALTAAVEAALASAGQLETPHGRRVLAILRGEQ
jgi:hypothetical protein